MSKDAANFKHPSYLSHFSQVKMVQDVYMGIDYASAYLVKQGRETDEGYAKRKSNATLRNFVQRSIEAFVGMIFRKQVQTTGLSDYMNKILSKVDTQMDLNMFARKAATLLVRDGKVFICVDTLQGGSDPYAVLFERNQVINWRKDENGKFTLLVIQQSVEEITGTFTVDYVDQYRVYDQFGNVSIYKEDKDSGEMVLISKVETEYDYIPVVEIDLSDIPPLYDVCKLNIKHMNRTSLKDKYLDMSATPIPIIWGTSDESNGSKPVYVIGVDEAFLFNGSKDESDFQWRELSGSSIKALQDDLKVIETEITTGVIRATVSETTTIKTATQSFYEAAEASNRVTVIAAALENGLNRMLFMLADLANETLEPTSRIIVNKDFNALVQNGDSLRLLWEVYLSGALSIETFLSALDSYEVIDIGSVSNELERIAADNFVPKAKKVDVKSIDNKIN